ncbi:MAG: hypothetical protein H0T79_13730 [Deltaproteobacteria bacterium]|nr:hypothetical protein [Deltaproteobacteria bacterium]
MRMLLALTVLGLSLGTLAACGEAKEKQDAPKAGSAVGSGADLSKQMVLRKETPEDIAKDKAEALKAEQEKGWVPAEFKTGASRWKDTGVYLDGQPIGFMTFGELPISLQPHWVKDKMSAEKRPGTNDPGWKWGQERFYKWVDYLKSLGVDIKKVKELHVYGPKFTQAIIATGKDLQSPLAQDFLFRFGVSVGGKAIPRLPAGFANGKTPDKVSAVMIYVNKTPPKLDLDEAAFVLDGKVVLGVPYYGEPLRGGVRIYLDDKFATVIKRQELDAKKATTTPDGDLHWGFYEFLTSKGVDTKKIVEAWVVNGERRREKISAAELEKLTFSAGSQAKGGVLMGDKKLLANAITIFTRELKPEDLPKILDEEEY